MRIFTRKAQKKLEKKNALKIPCEKTFFEK